VDAAVKDKSQRKDAKDAKSAKESQDSTPVDRDETAKRSLDGPFVADRLCMSIGFSLRPLRLCVEICF
jgi:hypothetical protein